MVYLPDLLDPLTVSLGACFALLSPVGPKTPLVSLAVHVAINFMFTTHFKTDHSTDSSSVTVSEAVKQKSSVKRRNLTID
jgi:uncharacterized membrane protein YgaE (UPF0421/DUF939 family)